MNALVIILLVVVVALGFILISVWNNKRKEREELNRLQLDFRMKEESTARSDHAYKNALEQVNLLQELLQEERSKNKTAEIGLNRLSVLLDNEREKLHKQEEFLRVQQEHWKNELEILTNKLLEEESARLTKMNVENLNQLLEPLGERIKGFEEKVEKAYNQEAAERNILKGALERMMKQTHELGQEASNLSKALIGDTKKQGDWGEVVLERVLEQSGLVNGREYRTQVNFTQEGGRRLQPDVIIDLPDSKHLVVDAKVSLTAYTNWVEAEDKSQSQDFAKQHVLSIRSHAKQLASKDYQSLYGISSPDFVLMFMPIESALSLAVKESPQLFSDAWNLGVVIVSPSTLLATLRTIASIWKQENQNRNVLEIAQEAGKLYDKFVGFISDMEQVDQLIQRAADKNQQAMKKLHTGNGNIVRRIENLKSLGARTGKQIDDKFLEP